MKAFMFLSLLLLVGVIDFGDALKCYECDTEDNGRFCNNLNTNTTASARFLKECPGTNTECVLAKVQAQSISKSTDAYTLVGRLCINTLGNCEALRERLNHPQIKFWNFQCETCNTDGCNRA